MPASTKLTPTHPGQILQTEFLGPRGITQSRLALVLNVKLPRVNELVHGKRGITPKTAWMLAGALGTTPEFWMNLQAVYDLARVRPPVPIKMIRSHGEARAYRR